MKFRVCHVGVFLPLVNLVLLLSLRQQLADLYQAIHSTANVTFLQTYEDVVHSLVSKSLENKLECEQMETNLKR